MAGRWEPLAPDGGEGGANAGDVAGMMKDDVFVRWKVQALEYFG